MTRKEIREFGQHIADKVFHKREQANTIIIKGWLARDKSSDIYFYKEKPVKVVSEWKGDVDWNIAFSRKSFPQINWEDNEPTSCEVIIKIEK